MRAMWIRYIMLLVLGGVPLWVRGQQILFRNYSVADGLCANTVWAIAQDNKGYMWFGTKDGLSRFDGYQFKTYHFDEEDSLSIGSNWVSAIFSCDADSSWIGTEKGMYILDLAHERFHFFKPIGKRHVFDMLRDRKGNIWIATGSGVFCYHPGTKKIERFMRQPGNPNALSLGFVRRLLLDDSGRIWMGTAWKGIDVYDPVSQNFQHYAATGAPGSLSSNFITALFKDSQGGIWIGTEKGGLNRWNAVTQSFQVFRHGSANSISDNIIHDIGESETGQLYIGTEKGLDVLDRATGQFRNYDYASNDPYSLSDNAVYAIYRDKAGGVWIGTYFGGVNYFHPRHTNFELYYPTGSPYALSGKAVSGMLQADSTHIWIGTEDGGLNYFNTETKQFLTYPFKAGQQPLSYHNIHTLIKDRQNKLWVGTFTGGVNVVDVASGRVKVYKMGNAKRESSYSNMVYDLLQDSSGRIWSGTTGGLYCYAPEQDAFVPVLKKGLDKSWIYDLFQDRQGTLWVGTYNNGLYKKTADGSWQHFNIKHKKQYSRSEKIICVQSAGPDALWLGTDGGGLLRFDKKTAQITSFKGQYGLQADIVYGSLEDNKGHLWLSTNQGIYDFDPAGKRSRHYSQWDHLQGRQFNYKAYLKSWDGKFYFGGVNGLNAFYPDSIHYLSSTPRITFTGFQLFNRDIALADAQSPLDKIISYTSHISLSHKQSMFSIGYAALNYVAPHKTRYAYKMEGYDEQWNEVDNQRKATYTNLPAGEYVFKVRATDNNGSWLKQPASIAITIRPPFYRTTLAYVLYALLLLAGIWLFRRLEIKRLKRKNQMRLERAQNKKEQEFYKQKIDFFTSMAHEIRTPLSLIIAPLEKLLQAHHWKPKVKEQLGIMDENANRLLQLTNQLLDFRRMESNLYTIRPERMEIVSLVQTLFSRFSAISYQKGIQFSVTAQVDRLEVQADPEALTKILSNLLINAFKFTRTEVTIVVLQPEPKEGQLCFGVGIEDDGIGIPKEDLAQVFTRFYQVSSGNHEYHNLGGNGIGLALAKALTEKHNGQLLVESQQHKKTVFTMWIPLVPAMQPTNGKTGSGSADTEPASAADPGTEAVLVVEDDLSLLDFISKSLAEAGYTPWRARNGREALERLETQNIDLILSDVMMSEIDGLQLCKQLKQSVDYSHIPLVLLTARANMEIEIEGIESGADAYITKPFKWKHVMAVIKNLLESRLKLKEKFSQQPFAEPGSLVNNSGDRKFLDRIIAIISQRLDDPQLSVESISESLGMSRSSLHKKLKAISGHVPNEFVRIIRLKEAAKLLLKNEFSISEIGYMTGFNSPSYFSKCFCKQFNLTPKAFIEKYLRQDVGKQ